MRAIRTLSAVLCASYLLSSAYATVLTFDNVGSTSIPYDYGSRVDASGVDVGGRTNFNLTHGATPNVIRDCARRVVKSQHGRVCARHQ